MLPNTNQAPQVPPPTQEELDAAGGIYDKLKLLSPEKYMELSERELSIIFSKVTKPFCCYNTTYKRWMFYNGKYWIMDTSGVKIRQVTNQFAYEFLRYAIDVAKIGDPFWLIANNLGNASTRNSLIKDSIDKNAVSDEEMDKDIYLINLQNGTYDLRKMELRKHSYKDMITKIANVEYSPGAQNNILDDFMNSTFSGNQDLIQYIYRVFGLCLSGEISPEAFWIFLGETTRNGKSTLMNTFAYMLGGTTGYAMNCDISSLAKKKYYNGSSPSSDIARLKGARFVVASEPPRDFSLDEAKVKALTGGDRITARMLRANDIEYTPTFKIFIGTNHRPSISDDSILRSNRIRIVPFLKHFNEDEQNKNLKEQLKSSEVLNALFINVLEGWSQYKTIGLAEPQIVREATAEYQTSGQVFDLFFDSTFERCEGNKITLSEFYPKYVEWCTENDFVIADKHDINSFMRAKGVYASSATVNGSTHRNVLVNYKYKSATPSTLSNNAVQNPPSASNNSDSNPNRDMIDTFMYDFGFGFPESSYQTPVNTQKNDPQITPNDFENRSLTGPDHAPF